MRARALLMLVATTSTVYAQDLQVGARARALGGAYSAFEDDPLAAWINPAGIARQPLGGNVSYQTSVIYETHGNPPDPAEPEFELNDPVFLPSFAGVVIPIGSAESPQALGLCFATPFHTQFAFNGPAPTTPTPAAVQVNEQTFLRLRCAYARTFRFRELGEPGLLTHVSAGLGADLAFSRAELSQPPVDRSPTDHSDLGFGGGGGLVIGLYDNARDIRINLGLALQSPVKFDFDADGKNDTIFDWPMQIQAGAVFYLLQDLPLSLSVDYTRIGWNDATRASRVPGAPDFQDAEAYGAGLEYQVFLKPGVHLLPRGGLRFEKVPWRDDSPGELPASGDYQLFIDTQGSRRFMFTLGLGLAWTFDDGTRDTLDIAVEVGGDAAGASLSYTFQF